MLDYLAAHRPASELLVVDDGSTDDTAQLAEAIIAQHPDVAARVSCARRRIAAKATPCAKDCSRRDAPIALFSDADLSTPLTECRASWAPIEARRIRCRFWLARAEPAINRPSAIVAARTGRNVFNGLVRLATGLPFCDTQCGFKAFRMEAARPIIERAADRRVRLRCGACFSSRRQAGLRPARACRCAGITPRAAKCTSCTIVCGCCARFWDCGRVPPDEAA